MNQTLLACGFASPDEVRTLLERCGVTVRRPLSDAETQYHQKHRHMRQSRNYHGQEWKRDGEGDAVSTI